MANLFETAEKLKESIGTEGRKIMKGDNHKKSAEKNEDGAVKKEIIELKQALENNRTLKNRELENNRNGKSKRYMVVTKLTKQHTKLWKSFESYDCFWEQNKWFERCIQKKLTSNGIPFDLKVCLKKQETEIVEDLLQPASCNLKETIIHCTDETDFEENLANFNNSERNAKNNIMQRFLEDITKTKIINQDGKEMAKCMMYIVNRKDFLKRDGKEIRQDNKANKTVGKASSVLNTPEVCPHSCNDKKKIEEAWKVWGNFTLATKQREKERETIENKIETFLTRIQERFEVENFLKQKKLGKNAKNFKDLKMVSENLRGRMRMREKMYEREKKLVEKDVRKESNIKEILGEIKSSRKETYERLLIFERQGKRERSKVLKIVASVPGRVDKTPKNFPIPTFLLRMAERQEECRNHNARIRKKKLEEERKNNHREQAKQMKAIEEFSKRKKLKKLNERKKVDEEKREKEKFKLKLAEVHYERILLRNYGLRPWLYLMNLRNFQQLRSVNFFRKKLMRRVFIRWKVFVRNQVEEKQVIITNIYHSILQKNCLKVWIKIREERIKQYQAAVDFYDLKITEKIFTKWLKFIHEEQLGYFNKREIADLHYTKKLKVTFLRKWKNYPEIQRLETAKEERKRIWRQKVKQILPDYRPVN